MVAWITHIFGVRETRFNVFKIDEQNLGSFLFFFLSFVFFCFVLNVGQYASPKVIIDVEGGKKEEQMANTISKDVSL